MQIEFLGAAQTVTGSQHLLRINDSRLLLDCGLYQGPRKQSYDINRAFAFEPARLNAVILSHAHIDHSGNLPNLVKQGFQGPIYATPATCDLTDLMLRDSGHIQERNANTINHRKRQDEDLVEPLYTEEDAAQVKPLLHPMNYNQVFEVVPGVFCRFVDAGHILGSAAVILEIEEKGRKTRLWFSGDIGRRDLPLLRDPILPDAADVMIMEATYGDKPHRDPELAFVEMREVVLRTLKRSGKLIIPAFAVGRTQEIVYNLNRMYQDGDLSNIPIYVDSPLAVNASQIFKQHPECFDEDAEAMLQTGHPALDFPLLTYIQSVDESKALNTRTDPMVIISASGMAETGRIVYHLRWAIENPRNTVMIVSWQAPETLGRRLAEKQETVRIFGEKFHRRAEVATIGGLSAHAGQNLLAEYAHAPKGGLQKLFLVHAEEKPAQALIERLKSEGLSEVYYPARGDVFDW